MIKLTIDGHSVEVPEGTSVLDAAAQAGVEIPTLCFLKSLPPFGACGLCVVEVEGSKKLLRACATRVREGLVVTTQSERTRRARKLLLELMLGDHEGDCLGPCRLECPAGTNCQKYVREIAEGRFADAVATVMETFPIPASIGRICPHPCERACRRGRVESPISLAALKAFAADQVRAEGSAKPLVCAPSTGRRVSIVGGGPAGLTAAYQLARRGHAVTIYEQMPEMGGMLRYGIPAYRLPREVLRAETAVLAALGVNFVNNFRIGRDATLEQLRAGCDALIVANGAWRSASLHLKGENLKGVWGGIDFLRAVAQGEAVKLGARVAVVGGGNVAMDACRTAVRCGAKEVFVVYRRTRDEMPAEAQEIAEAEEEGVVYRFLRNPAEILEEKGVLKGVRLQVMQLGEPDERGRRRPVPVPGEFETLELDDLIIAAGQQNDPEGFESLPKTGKGTLAVDEATFATGVDGVFACGDAVNRGAGIAIAAIAQANRAAQAVDAFLAGRTYAPLTPIVSRREAKKIDFSAYEKLPRVESTVRPAAERRSDFQEVALGLTPEQAQREARRCLECGCHDYADCRLIRYANQLRADAQRFAGERHPGGVERKLVVIERNHGKCINCNLCVRICSQEVGRSILARMGRGFATAIEPIFANPAEIAVCATCHRCVDDCPTGALRLMSHE